MEALVQGENPAAVPLHPSGLPICKLKPSALVRILNTAGFGEVISDRQLYRYRQRAGYQIGDGRTVDLIRFTAWMATERHPVARSPGSQRTTRPSERPNIVTAQEVHELLVRQDYRCALSGYDLQPEDAAMDHILAVSRGGPHTIENAQILRKDVNRAKGTLTNEEFIALCRAVVAHADAR
jgi:5-methylcytosine-specific restriction endonuclease McrA